MTCFWKNFETSTDLQQNGEASLVHTVYAEVDVPMASLYHWYYEPCWLIQDLLSKMPKKMHKNPRSWTRWLESEIDERNENTSEADYYDELWRWWSEDPTVAPVMVPLNNKGRVDKRNPEANPIWAGHHRLALAIEHGWTHAPVIYSVLKNKSEIQLAFDEIGRRFGSFTRASMILHHSILVFGD
jgi:hypothetical protein